jgi:hypothetical protein
MDELRKSVSATASNAEAVLEMEERAAQLLDQSNISHGCRKRRKARATDRGDFQSWVRHR